jgi:hypothetical protein
MTSMDTPLKKGGPGCAAYLLGCLPLLAGFGVMIAILVVSLPKMNAGLEQIVVPGERSLTLEPGYHMVFLETRSVVDGRAYETGEVSGLTVHVVGADGTPVTVTTPGASATYSVNGREGHAINGFQIDRAGAYTVSADYGGAEGPQAVIAVGQGFLGGLFSTVFGGLAAVFIGALVALGVLVWVLVMRRRAGHSI